LVVNAGGPPAGRFDDFEDQDWYDAFELTIKADLESTKKARPK